MEKSKNGVTVFICIRRFQWWCDNSIIFFSPSIS